MRSVVFFIVLLSVIMLSTTHAECRYADGHYAECRYADLHNVECRGAQLHPSLIFQRKVGAYPSGASLGKT